MSLNDQVKSMPTTTQRARVFKDGVKFKYLTGKDPTVFKFLPAFNPANPDPSTSILPFVRSDGILTDWGMLLYQARLIGHGSGKFSTRQDVLSLRTFAAPGQEVFDPVEHLVKVINQMSGEWGYLLKDGPTKEDRAPLSRPVAHFIGDIWDANQPSAGVQIGILSPSATSSLLDPRFGLAFQRGNVPDNYIQQDYLLAYAVGDLTDPVKGPALESLKEEVAKGNYSKYRIRMAQDGQGQIYRPMIGPQLLIQRHHFANPATFINVPTEEEIINTLVQLFNMRSPTGIHEYVLLKIAFPNHRIPEPPSATGASPTVQSGFGVNPAAPAAPQAPSQYVPAPAQPPAQPDKYSPFAAPPALPAGTPVNATPAAGAPATAPAATPPAPPAAVPGDPIKTPDFNEQEFIAKLRSQMNPAVPAK